MEFDQKFDDYLDYGNLESIYENEFSDTINSDSLDDECEPILNNMNDEPKTFDGTKPDINWNHKSPYGLFGNFMNMVIFIWATKYMISTAAYQDLIQILLHPQFEIKHLTTNLKCLKKQYEWLPLMKIQSQMILINTKNTPSMSKDSARVYYFSLIEHIQRILKNLTLSSHLYFGPGVFSKSCEELWEGDLWAESPLFSLPNLVTMQNSFNCDDFVKYNSTSETIEIGQIRSFVIVNKKISARIQRLLHYEQVPQFLRSKQYSPHSSQELYLVEESELFIIDPSNLICCVNIWPKDQHALPNIDFFVNKILYKYNR
ncbi:Serine/threonine protein kinase [Gigaspora margarita]|uniref:Serine/threonine protein kinase n=1 Tax=Gigaspora margarita TaxID=4874 RepID=A0A8H4ELD2_GIGMA|nr:Serine/threonine protein kinase [Gigaspora margarita]